MNEQEADKILLECFLSAWPAIQKLMADCAEKGLPIPEDLEQLELDVEVLWMK